MQYSLGIDAGGTYTDAVIIKDSDGKVIDYKKSLTTYPDILEGIENVIDSLDQENLGHVGLVSVSTTLSTNSLLEGTGTPVGVILIGEHPMDRDLPTRYVTFVDGGHDHNGEELLPLDTEKLKQFVESTKKDVAAFVVSGYFGTRNPDHELKGREIINELTGLPVVCGHELSQDLGAYERVVTAFLNAQLIPITKEFVQSVIQDVKRRGINARMLMLRCDGSVVNIEDTLQRPIETIFSGPAASLMGASYLTGLDDCAVVDVGGTSTDVAAIYNGIPEIVDTGAVVGGWKTRVKALKMETSAIGGDSHVGVTDRELFIGPRRVIPLCVASARYPDFLRRLRRNQMVPRDRLDKNYQPTKYFVRTKYRPYELKTIEKEVLDTIDNEPVSIKDIISLLGREPPSEVLDSLIRKRLVQAIGFSPTDALHVLEEYTHWDSEASNVGAEKLCKLKRMDRYEFCKYVKEEVAKSITADLLAYLVPDMSARLIDNFLRDHYPTRFKLQYPVVLLGGPTAAFADEINKLIDADIRVPEFASVGNAVGALVGKGIKRVEIMIRPSSLTNPDEDFLVFTPSGRERFHTYLEALDHADKLGRKIIGSYIRSCGIDESRAHVNVKKNTIIPDGWSHAPMETKLVFLGVGTTRVYSKKDI